VSNWEQRKRQVKCDTSACAPLELERWGGFHLPTCVADGLMLLRTADGRCAALVASDRNHSPGDVVSAFGATARLELRQLLGVCGDRELWTVQRPATRFETWRSTASKPQGRG
jgi:hypothetical protein